MEKVKVKRIYKVYTCKDINHLRIPEREPPLFIVTSKKPAPDATWISTRIVEPANMSKYPKLDNGGQKKILEKKCLVQKEACDKALNDYRGVESIEKAQFNKSKLQKIACRTDVRKEPYRSTIDQKKYEVVKVRNRYHKITTDKESLKNKLIDERNNQEKAQEDWKENQEKAQVDKKENQEKFQVDRPEEQEEDGMDIYDDFSDLQEIQLNISREEEDQNDSIHKSSDIFDEQNEGYIVDDELNKSSNVIDELNPEVEFRCALCNFICSKQRDYTIHMQQHEFIRAYERHKENGKMPISRRYSYVPTESKQNDIRTPAPIIKAKRVDKCTLCSVSCLDKESLEDHMQLHKNGTGEHVCPLCKKDCVSKGSLKLHLNIHLRTCYICQQSFQMKSEFRKHMQTHQEAIPCPICPKSFNTQDFFVRHLHDHTKPSEDRVYTCKQCVQTFKSEECLTAHMKTTHPKKYECDTCGAIFAYRSNLIRHRDEKCSFVTQYKCGKCEMQFSNNVNLLDHMESHLVEKPYSCGVCGKLFSLQVLLLSHMQVHSGDKYYPCEICGEILMTRCDFIKHVEMHTGPTAKKRFHCDICSSHFSDKKCLKIHTKIHTGENLYDCDACKKMFLTRTSLNTHLKRYCAGMKT